MQRAAASGFYVSPSGDLIMYATEHDNDGPNATVRMSEFSSQDGYDQPGSCRPTAVPGGPTLASPTRGCRRRRLGQHARRRPSPGRVLRRAQLRRPRPGHRLLRPRQGGLPPPEPGGGLNDEASSVRWRIPKGCEAVLFDDKDYKGPRVTLSAAQGGPQADAGAQEVLLADLPFSVRDLDARGA